MNKVRIYEVARDLGLDPQELVKKTAALGIQVRNHMSTLDEADAERVRRQIEKEKSGAVVKERLSPTVVRRRTVAAPAAPVAPAEAKPAAKPAPDARPAPVEAKAPAPPAPAPAEAKAPAAAEPKPAARVATPAPHEEEPAAAPAPAAAAPAAVAPATPPPPAPAEPPARISDHRRSSPPPASERLGHANLPPGVVARGSSIAPSAPTLSREAAQRIVAQHMPRGAAPAGGPGGDVLRKREIGRAALGPTGRQPQPGRPGRAGKKLPPGKKGAKPEITVPSAQKRHIRIEESVGLQTLAMRMSLKATDVLMKLMTLGMTGVNINSTLDADTAKILANEFGYEVENVARSETDIIADARGKFEDVETDRKHRAPVVTIMGHVDHGKTSLLDRIRSANVAGGEAGGITQHIGAYRVETPKGMVVFLDTPGHEAFTAMRARGGHAADVVILVVAADDGVMPQTKEAIHHAKAAEVPIVVAVNKIDKPDARPEVVRRELANEGLQTEEWGGNTIFVDVSAKTGVGLDKLLESVLLQAEVLELDANPKIPAEGIVLEAYLDKGRGPVANVLVQNGTLNTGDVVLAGAAFGKVRAMSDDRGRPISSAGPSTPVEVLGLSEVPGAGDTFLAVTDAKKAQEIAAQRVQAKVVKAVTPSMQAKSGLEQLQSMLASGQAEALRLVIKGDVSGSVEAIVKALTDLSTEKVRVEVIHTGVGGITENDVMLSSASKAVVIGFNVRPAGNAAALAKAEGVDVRLYTIIYEAVDEVKKAMQGLLAPTFTEKHLGSAEVRQVFTIPKAGTIAGSFVLDGKISRASKIRLVRDSVPVWEGKLGSLRRFKDDVREVAAGFECGIGLEGFNDVKEKDVIEAFEMQEVAGVL